MPRFICSHPTTSLIKHITPRGKVLAFDHRGMLHTDEEGAAVLRADPLFGRLILEGDESAPAHGEVPALQTPREVVLPPVAQERRKRAAPRGLEAVAVEVECAVCRERFIPRSLNGGRRLYCSGKCRDRAYRAKRGAKPRWYVKLLQDPFGHDKNRTKSPVRGVVVKVGERVKVIFP